MRTGSEEAVKGGLDKVWGFPGGQRLFARQQRRRAVKNMGNSECRGVRHTLDEADI